MEDADPALLPHPPFDRAGRDGYRTPMQWDASPNGGFTSGSPWLPPVDPAERNVAAQRDDPRSLLNLYRRLISARRTCQALRVGRHRSIFGAAPDVLAWLREADGERVLCLLNVGDVARACDLPTLGVQEGEVVVATHGRSGRVELSGVTLQALEGLALRL
jgi:glycosidase